VIARDGWHGLRMEAVAREAGVSKALVHYYFSTRRALLRAAFAHSEELANERAERELARLATPAKRLEHYLALDFADDPVFAENRALWTEVWSGMREDVELRPDVEQRYRAWVDRIAELVRDVSAELPAEAVALRLAALVDGLESLLLLRFVTPERARALLSEGIANELAAAGANPGARALVTSRGD
jgi:AcrR family transcriptional regulator